MKKRLELICAVGCIALLSVVYGCAFEQSEPDQCLRSELFQKCLSSVPDGPLAAKYNDWAEVVSECGSQAYYQSIRSTKSIKVGCR